MDHRHCYTVFRVIGEGLNSSLTAVELLESAARAIAEAFGLKACHFRMLSRDQQVLEHVASWGLSQEFLDKGPVDAEKSVADALRGEIVAIADCATDSRIQYSREFADEGIVSLLTVPLETRGQVVGVMRLASGQPREFTTEEKEFFRVAALFCTSALIHSMFHQIVEHVIDAIRSSLDLDDVLDTIVRVVADDLRAKGCSIRLCDPRSPGLELRASCGLSRAYLERTSQGPGPAVMQALEGQCVAVLDARTDSRIRNTAEVIQEHISSILFVPLMVRNEAIGVLSLYTHKPYEFSKDEMALMLSIGEQCALAIRNAQMYSAVKRRYENVVDEFHLWFEHYLSYPGRGPEPRD